MSDYFVYNSIDSRTYGAYVFDAGTDDSPIYQYETQEIPGKSGDLLININRRQNVEHRYNVIIPANIDAAFLAMRSALLAVDGYARLEDSIHPDEFYTAYLGQDIQPTFTLDRDAVKFGLTFLRKPQRWLKSGETATPLTEDGEIVNPTQFIAKPLLRVYGTGIVGIGSYEFEITQADEYTDIDCEMMECYKDTYAVNCNGNVVFANYEFPRLHPNSNAVALGTGITQIDITPRWYVL